MKMGSLRQLCAVAVAAALATPAVAQDTERSFEANQGSNAARGAAGEAGTVGPAAQPGATQPGTTVRPGAPPAGTVIEQDLQGRTLNEQGTRTANYPPGQEQAQGQINDRVLAQWISANNEGEIRVNELAQEKAENQQVKQFAQKMIQDHTQFREKLRQAAGAGAGAGAGQGQGRASQRGDAERQPHNVRENRSGLNRSTDENRNETDANRENRNEAESRRDENQVNFQQPDRNAPGINQDRAVQRGQGQPDRARAGMRGGNPLLSLHQEIAEKCTQSTIEALREKEGAKFDHAFMHQQVIAHMAMLDTLQVSQNHASGELKQILQQGEQKTQQHLQEAKSLLEQVESQENR